MKFNSKGSADLTSWVNQNTCTVSILGKSPEVDILFCEFVGASIVFVFPRSNSQQIAVSSPVLSSVEIGGPDRSGGRRSHLQEESYRSLGTLSITFLSDP